MSRAIRAVEVFSEGIELRFVTPWRARRGSGAARAADLLPYSGGQLPVQNTNRANEDKAALSARISNDSGGGKFLQIRPEKGHEGRWSAFVWGMALRALPAE